MPYNQDQEKIENAVNVAQMYYYQNMKTEAIAKELKVSRSTVSRLLTFARKEGLVSIKITTPTQELFELEKRISDAFDIKAIHVVPVPEIAGEAIWLIELLNMLLIT